MTLNGYVCEWPLNLRTSACMEDRSYMVPCDLGFVMECIWSYLWIDLSLYIWNQQMISTKSSFFLFLISSGRIHLVSLEKGNDRHGLMVGEDISFKGRGQGHIYLYHTREVVGTTPLIWATFFVYLLKKKGKGDGVMG